MKNICKRLSVILVITCVFFNSGWPILAVRASYLPGISVGSPVTTESGLFQVNIGNFLSHVLDESLDALEDNFGRLWNDVIDTGYCPSSINHRHEFVYGLTSTSKTLDGDNILGALATTPTNGYYCYCKHCGQLAGDLIEDKISENNVTSESGQYYINVYPDSVGVNINDLSIVYPQYVTQYGVDMYLDDVVSIPFIQFEADRVRIGNDNPNTGSHSISGYFIFNLENITSSITISDVTVFRNFNALTYYDNNDNVWTSYSYNPPEEVGNNRYNVINGNCILLNGYVQGYGGRGYFDFTGFSNLSDYPFCCKVNLNTSDIDTLYNYDNVHAPIVYENDGNVIYGGLSSDIVDNSNSIYYNPQTNKSYDFSSAEYDFSTNSYTITINDYDQDGVNDNEPVVVTVRYEDDKMVVSEDGNTYVYYYVTNTQTPVQNISNGNASITGSINVTVNQTSTETNAYITTHEDIPDGLYDLREELAQGFTAFPQMIGDVGDFMNEGFSYIPDSIKNLLIFGMTCAVFVGIFKLFFR